MLFEYYGQGEFEGGGRKEGEGRVVLFLFQGKEEGPELEEEGVRCIERGGGV